MFDVITVGSATVDAFVNTGSQLFRKTKTKNVSVPFGSKILIEDLKFDIGGGGTNTAVAFSRLGLKTGYIGSVGCGNNSQRVMKLLKKEKIDISLLQCGKGRTGFSVILDAKQHDRTILNFRGNNNDLDYNKIKKPIKTKWFYFSAMLGKSFETQKKLANYAKKNNIKIAYNPSSYLSKKGAKHISYILKRTDLLVLNKEEAEYLVGKKDTLNKLLKLGPKLAVITDGKKSTYASDGEKVYSIKPNNIKVIETTGAGDAFAATFLTGLIKNKDIKCSLKMGLKNAQSVIQHYGAKNKLLTYKELKC